MKKMNKIKNPDAFLMGMKDCRKGIAHNSGRGKDYDKGYSAQYHNEQNITGLSRGH